MTAPAPPIKKAAVVVADFYQDISAQLLASCSEALAAAGLERDLYTVRGALEIPPAVARLAASGARYRCFVALGCVIRGETYHFEVVAHSSAAGLMQVSLQHGAAIGNGILTVESKAQALARAGKGADAARAALVLADIAPS